MCWFVSKKKYDAMVADRDKWDEIASKAVAQNGRLLTQMDEAVKEMKEIQELNHRLVEHNDELLAQCQELETKLKFAIKQRDYYYDLLENSSEVEESDE
jgi:predicted transcriptional regulator